MDKVDYLNHMVEAAQRRKRYVQNIEYIKIDLSDGLNAHKLETIENAKSLLLSPPGFLLTLSETSEKGRKILNDFNSLIDKTIKSLEEEVEDDGLEEV